MTLSDIVLRDPAILSYGLCALAFLAFVVHLGLGWRGGAKATLLLAVVAMSATWAALNVAFGVTEAPVFWRAQALVDSLRVGGWIVFLASRARRGAPDVALERRALLVLPVVAIGLPPVGPEAKGSPLRARLSLRCSASRCSAWCSPSRYFGAQGSRRAGR